MRCWRPKIEDEWYDIDRLKIYLSKKYEIPRIKLSIKICELRDKQGVSISMLGHNTLSNLEHGAEVDNPSSGVHGVSGNIVGTSDTQTLTNKTIDAGSNTISGVKDFITGLIESPADQDYMILRNAPFGGTINKITTKSSSGTCTLTGYVGATALEGTANSVSSSEQEQSHSSSNTFSSGDDIKLTVSSNSSCEDLEFTVEFTRSL
jgi:hypothetical protein